ncbi:MAG: iron-sulfur cluster assembly protein [Bacteroidales bacterium]|jgi:FeS assembly SUF system protein|nr:iron-sulfur cluster assembly protein [Bacteroidales bacterium]
MPSERKNNIIEALKKVYDPEIPVNVYDLGLIYDIIDNDGDVKIVMTLTAPNCPVAEILPLNVKDAAMAVDGVKNVDIEITFEPAWSPEKMSDAAKIALDMLY